MNCKLIWFHKSEYKMELLCLISQFSDIFQICLYLSSKRVNEGIACDMHQSFETENDHDLQGHNENLILEFLFCMDHVS